MRKVILLVSAAWLLGPGPLVSGEPPAAANGIHLFPDFISWKVVAPSYREDKGHIRVVTGNEIAVAALRAGTRPLPDGSVLAKAAWKAEKSPSYPVATQPGDFVQVEFMVKDAQRYKDTGGWGFARFVGNGLTPYGKDAAFAQECFDCHKPVAGNDYLFTHLVNTP